MKNLPGKSLGKFLCSFEKSATFKGVALRKSDTDEEIFSAQKKQFFQCLYDNLTERFPSTDLLKAAKALDPNEWPSDCLEKTLFGHADVAFLCKLLLYSSSETVEVLSDFGSYKTSLKVGIYLKELMGKIAVYPISSAACERGFSAMNLQHTKTRNQLNVETVSSLQMIAVNGPPVEY